MLTSLAFLLSANLAFANPIELESSFSAVHAIGNPYADYFFILSIIVVGLGSEILFGYLFFFRHNKKGVSSLIYANLISYPIFYIFTTAIHILPIPLGEVLAVIIEAAFIKLYLGNEMSIKKSLLISILLNILSIIISLFLSVLLQTSMAPQVVF